MDEMLFWGADIPKIIKKYLSINNPGMSAMTEQEKEIYKLGQKSIIGMLEQLLLADDGEHFTVQISGLDVFQEMDVDELSKRFNEMKERSYG